MKARRPQAGRRLAAALSWLSPVALALAACATAGPGSAPTSPPARTPPPAATLALTPAPSQPAANSSGIEGQILIGPACPGPVSAANPCPDQPYQATVRVLDAAGRLVTEFESDAQGRFRVPLPPGAYTLEPQSPGALPHAGPQSVTVAAGQYTTLTLTYDSGIR